MAEAIIEVRDVCLVRNGIVILDNLNWRMNAGEHWAVIGANGSGKTSLLQIAGTILFPTSGEVTVFGQRFGKCELMKLRRRIGWVGPALLGRMPPEDTLWDIVASGFKSTFGRVDDPEAEQAGLVDEVIERIGLGERKCTFFGVLSQGEQQRALFGRLLLTKPELYIMDEACSGLDLPARETFLKTVGKVMREDKAESVTVTHHIEELPPIVSHVLVLKKGRVFASGAVEDVLTSQMLSDTFEMKIDVRKIGERYWATLPE